MKAIYVILPLALLAGCSNTARIASTDETVTHMGTDYEIYIETVHRNEAVWGKDMVDQRKLVYVDSRYLRCDGNCLGVVKSVKGP